MTGGPVSRQTAVYHDWVTLVEDAMPALRRFAAVYVSAALRDDLVQDTLAQAWSKRANYDPDKGTFRAWSMAILRNIAARRYQHNPPHLSRVAAPRVEPDTDIDRLLDLRSAVDTLPVRQREVIILHYYVDLRLLDIATMLDVRVGTVKSTLHEAKKTLAERLGIDDEN
jgi:RNA polymerase sigma factor (sigma-70 family)